MSPPPVNSPLLSYNSMDEKNPQEKVPSDDEEEYQDPNPEDDDDTTTGSTISNSSNSPVVLAVRFVTKNTVILLNSKH